MTNLKMEFDKLFRTPLTLGSAGIKLDDPEILCSPVFQE